MAFKLIVAPAEEPISLDDVKTFLKQTGITAEDTTISSLIVGARQYAEWYQNRPLITQTWGLYLDRFPRCSLEIELKPGLQSVVSIKYYLADGTETVFSADNYEVDSKSLIGRIRLKKDCKWPDAELQTVNGVYIEFVCGYGDAPSVPDLTKTAMQIWIAHNFVYRQGEEELPKHVNILLGLNRVIPV
jgi:uncharacterized phiE125 gp8 family phage protein